ncbi:hypothetical protein P4O66_003759 [Electrophorus voltai]|uniref:Ig-like domain-containing protein n=1 Tax=Electrophorus voltai TaxID=2609070 RepID=A0AAD9E1Y1_9TELE|nr:hypothetical protein P4O66_003759 [Electrophorus voltai]
MELFYKDCSPVKPLDPVVISLGAVLGMCVAVIIAQAIIIYKMKNFEHGNGLVQTINLANQAVLIQPGENITLNCTFKEKYDINPSMWYKQRPNQEPQQVGEVLKNKQAIPSSPFSNSTFKIIWDDTTNSLTILNLTEDYKGTYFCAVTDGRMIHFSSATFVNVTDCSTVKPMGPVVICLGAVLGMCAAVIIAQAIIICKMKSSESGNARPQEGSVMEKTNSQVSEDKMQKTGYQENEYTHRHDAEELNYAAIHFNERKTKRGQVKRGQHEDRVYSEVKRSALTDYHLDY